MGEIELTGIRPCDRETPTLDSSHEGLLTSETTEPGVTNGNGHIHPESEAFLGGPSEKPASVSVFKKPRRKWWILVLVISLVIIILTVCLGVIFGISSNSEANPALPIKVTTINTSLVTPSPSLTSKPVPDLFIKYFQSYSNPGTSKLFEVSFSNGSTLQTFGHKGLDGSFHSLYSISIGGTKGTDLTRIQFKGQNNFASVLLPQGTIVTYDWTSGFKSLECKIFSVPKHPSEKEVPLSHILTLPLGEYAEILVRISQGLIKPHLQSRTNVSRQECNSRLPLRVTKCGSQYTYPGSFIQGTLTSETGPSVSMDVLPWPRTQDNCHDNPNEAPNYFLPLPVTVTGDTIQKNFCSSGVNVFENLCLSIEGSDANLDEDLCSDLAQNVKEENYILYQHIFDSCHKIFRSIRLMCVGLKVSSSNEVNINQFVLSKNEIYQSLKVNISSIMDVLRGPRLYVDLTAYCPSVQPVTSYRQLIHINQSNPNTLQNMLHINCPGSPEIKRYVLGHKLIGKTTSSPDLDRIDHMFHPCFTCAFGTVMRVEVSRDDTCCKNNCTRAVLCEKGPHVPHMESVEFSENSDVYCHKFFGSFINRITKVNRSCVRGCTMKFSVEFKLYDSQTSQMYYHQTLSCDKNSTFACKDMFGR